MGVARETERQNSKTTKTIKQTKPKSMPFTMYKKTDLIYMFFDGGGKYLEKTHASKWKTVSENMEEMLGWHQVCSR